MKFTVRSKSLRDSLRKEYFSKRHSKNVSCIELIIYKYIYIYRLWICQVIFDPFHYGSKTIMKSIKALGEIGFQASWPIFSKSMKEIQHCLQIKLGGCSASQPTFQWEIFIITILRFGTSKLTFTESTVKVGIGRTRSMAHFLS